MGGKKGKKGWEKVRGERRIERLKGKGKERWKVNPLINFVFIVIHFYEYIVHLSPLHTCIYKSTSYIYMEQYLLFLCTMLDNDVHFTLSCFFFF